MGFFNDDDYIDIILYDTVAKATIANYDVVLDRPQ